MLLTFWGTLCNLGFNPTRTIRCHSLYQSLSVVVIRCHILSFDVTRCHSFSRSLSLVALFVVNRCTTRCHLLSLCHSMYTLLSFYKQSHKRVTLEVTEQVNNHLLTKTKTSQLTFSIPKKPEKSLKFRNIFTFQFESIIGFRIGTLEYPLKGCEKNVKGSQSNLPKKGISRHNLRKQNEFRIITLNTPE